MDKRARQENGRAFATVAGKGKEGRREASRRGMKMWKRLQNPFLLVGQGFVLGGILFFATHFESLLA